MNRGAHPPVDRIVVRGAGARADSDVAAVARDVTGARVVGSARCLVVRGEVVLDHPPRVQVVAAAPHGVLRNRGQAGGRPPEVEARQPGRRAQVGGGRETWRDDRGRTGEPPDHIHDHVGAAGDVVEVDVACRSHLDDHRVGHGATARPVHIGRQGSVRAIGPRDERARGGGTGDRQVRNDGGGRIGVGHAGHAADTRHRDHAAAVRSPGRRETAGAVPAVEDAGRCQRIEQAAGAADRCVGEPAVHVRHHAGRPGRVVDAHLAAAPHRDHHTVRHRLSGSEIQGGAERGGEAGWKYREEAGRAGIRRCDIQDHRGDPTRRHAPATRHLEVERLARVELGQRRSVAGPRVQHPGWDQGIEETVWAWRRIGSGVVAGHVEDEVDRALGVVNADGAGAQADGDQLGHCLALTPVEV